MIFICLLSFSGVGMANEEGKQLFETRCAICHQLPEPAMLQLKQWRLVLKTMQNRMQKNGLPPLTEDEFALVLNYLADQIEHK
jgi:mono/diheme cytochrome c family protein